MLQALHVTLILDELFKACIWAMITCAFWGMMHFGEVSVSSRSTCNPAKHLKHEDAHFDYDLDRKLYMCLDLPSAKTAKPGEIQSVYMVPQEGLCPLKALQNLAKVVPASKSDSLFSSQDRIGSIHPIVKSTAINHINSIIKAWG
jgi:hypothetical protein